MKGDDRLIVRRAVMCVDVTARGTTGQLIDNASVIGG